MIVVNTMAKSAPIVNESRELGIPVLNSTPQLYDQLAPTARSLSAGRSARSPPLPALGKQVGSSLPSSAASLCSRRKAS